MQSERYIEVMALLNAMVRCFHDHIGSVDINRLRQPLLAGEVIAAVTTSAIEVEKA